MPDTHTSAAATPVWAVVPLAAYLMLVAVGPSLFGPHWDRHRKKLVVAVLAALPVLGYLATRGALGALAHAGLEYAAFMALLGSLFVVAGGLRVRGTLAGTTPVNTAILAAGAVLANLIGTTGASLVLIRPLLRANQQRRHTAHVVVFFIFIVANGGGLLTPFGDPPLFFGFLRGVPFTWTLRLVPQWAIANALLLAAFAIFDWAARARDQREAPAGAGPPTSAAPREPLALEGRINLVWLLGIIGVVLMVGALGARGVGDHTTRTLIQVGAMLALALLSWKTTARDTRAANDFHWAPLVEVAVIFLGVFVAMIPVLSYLQEQASRFGLTRPWQYFWATGLLSSVLDNAPTYLAFAALAVGSVGPEPGVPGANDLAALAAHPTGQHLLAAISCGAVLMGAMTYVGNGPNLMVKAIAEHRGVKVPTFFGYLSWAAAILLPLYALLTLLFF